jgi:hypothetical protein
LKSPHESPHKVVIHIVHKKSLLNSWDHAPSLKLAHQNPFAITYKTIKQTKNRNKPKNNFFSALETPRHQQFSRRVELRFAAFIHRKHLTLFLGYRTFFPLYFNENKNKNNQLTKGLTIFLNLWY